MLVTLYCVLMGQEHISRITITKGLCKKSYFNLKKTMRLKHKNVNKQRYYKGTFLPHFQHIMQDIGRLVQVCKAPLHLHWFQQHMNGELRPSAPTTGKMQ